MVLGLLGSKTCFDSTDIQMVQLSGRLPLGPRCEPETDVTDQITAIANDCRQMLSGPKGLALDTL